MNDILSLAIKVCSESPIAFSKFITANDTGINGAHQAGFYIHKNSWRLFFSSPGERGANKDLYIKIKWQNDFETDSRFTYYGRGSRNEYRLTRFGKGFPFLQDDNVGDLLIISKEENRYYQAFVLSRDEDIEAFFNAFGISSTETNGILPKTIGLTAGEKLQMLFKDYITNLTTEFPSTNDIAIGAREIFLKAYSLNPNIVLKQPDRELLNWTATEFELFKAIENDRYGQMIKNPFKSVDELIKIANSILNRRKARAGKSLEHHLEEVFNIWRICHVSQAVIEGNKKPDFIFPDIKTYYSEPAGSKRLIFLGSKTTCKDRWRQIINEADRIPQKHLFTLQQGISSNQLKEMKNSNVVLVVPKPYLRSFPEKYREEILTLEKFLHFVKEVQDSN